jgi:hypothetical protein
MRCAHRYHGNLPRPRIRVELIDQITRRELGELGADQDDLWLKENR